MGCGASSNEDFILVDGIPSSRSTWSYQYYRPGRSHFDNKRGLGWHEETVTHNRNFPNGEINQNGLQIRLRRHLSACCQGKNVGKLEEALGLYQKFIKTPDDTYYTAVRKLEFLKLREGLREGLRRRHAGVLDKAIKDALKSPHAERLRSQVKVAEKLRDHLRELTLVKHEVRMEIDLKTISEVRSYQRPPNSVSKVTAAACMLLGYSDRLTRCWADVQTVLSRTGRDNPLQLMHEFDPSVVPQHIADRVDSILCRYRLDEVRIASHGAASLYVWADEKLDQVYALNGWRRRQK
ncbi:uncharacterized protein [Haliotis cracherodii]|uniref:uncharacterized protein n=1 Tax=Haliotis cracherodii TaxID=6455 RepID=UPI0039EB8B48